MDANNKLIARKLFRLRVLESKGIGFQNLLEVIMGYANPDFKPIRPYGNAGDRKNDGYCRSSGVFYQVYAPNDPNLDRTIVAAAKKSRTDFEGMMKHWSNLTTVNEYRFVFNDGYGGCPAPVEQALLAITKDFGIPATSMLAKDLEDLVMALPEDQLLDIIRTPIPSHEPMDDIDFRVLAEVVDHIFNLQIPLTIDSILVAPDFEMKIKFNGLSPGIAAILTVASYQIDAVKDYFSKNSNYAKQQLRDMLASVYMESKIELDCVNEVDRSDLIFLRILDSTTPKLSNTSDSKSLQDAASVVLAYFFEACDIFEEPNATS